MDTRGLVGLVQLVALPVLDEMLQRVHQSGRLEVLLAVGLDRVDRVSQTRRVLNRRELTLHAGQDVLTIHRRVRSPSGRAAGCIRCSALLVLFGRLRGL